MSVSPRQYNIVSMGPQEEFQKSVIFYSINETWKAIKSVCDPLYLFFQMAGFCAC